MEDPFHLGIITSKGNFFLQTQDGAYKHDELPPSLGQLKAELGEKKTRLPTLPFALGNELAAFAFRICLSRISL